MDCSSQVPSLARPSSSPARASSRLLGIGPGAGKCRRFGHPKQHVIESIQIAENGKRSVRARPDRCRLCLRHEPRQGGVEVALHGGNILLQWQRGSRWSLPVGDVEVGDGGLHIGQRGAQVCHGKPGTARRRGLDAAAGLGPWRLAAPTGADEKQGQKSEFGGVGGWDILSPDDSGEGAVATCGAFDGLGMLQQNKGCSSLCGPVAQLGARFHGMEEVIGSIPIRSTTLTP